MQRTMQKGNVYWITGLSGAGKTTIGKLFYEKLKSKNQNVVFLDGDILREIFNNEYGYSIEERRKLALSYSKLCKLLSDQSLDVVCATISMFHECRKWNRENIENYKEIYLRAPIDVLKSRDKKNLYSKENNVVGLDLQFEEPIDPDIILNNDGTELPENVSERLFKAVSSNI